ncbi:MAG: hypothetical protein ACREJD_00370 [Phycisphaerales bacterium]
MNYSVFSAGNDRWWFRLRENDGTILLVGDIHSCRQDVIHAIERTRECSQHERLFKKLDLGKENFGFLLDAADGIFLARSMSFRTAAIRQSVIMHIRDHALRAPLHPLASQT